jgi:hypothetical protein
MINKKKKGSKEDSCQSTTFSFELMCKEVIKRTFLVIHRAPRLEILRAFSLYDVFFRFV